MDTNSHWNNLYDTVFSGHSDSFDTVHSGLCEHGWDIVIMYDTVDSGQCDSGWYRKYCVWFSIF